MIKCPWKLLAGITMCTAVVTVTTSVLAGNEVIIYDDNDFDCTVYTKEECGTVACFHKSAAQADAQAIIKDFYPNMKLTTCSDSATDRCKVYAVCVDWIEAGNVR